MTIDLQTPSVVEGRYQRARQLAQHAIFPGKSHKLAFNTLLNPYWISESEYFWYEHESPAGKQYRLVNAVTLSNEPAFHHADLAIALSQVAKEKIDPNNLPITQLDFEFTPWYMRFTAFQQRWKFDGKRCNLASPITPLEQGTVTSPDGKYCVFVRDHNLWLRSLNKNEDGDEKTKERPLTYDGEEHYAYGAVPSLIGAGQDFSLLGNLDVAWSPDSSRLFAVQLDMRQVKSLPVVHHVPKGDRVRPILEEYRYPMPGDTHIPEYRLVAIDIESGDIISADYPSICFAFQVSFFNSQRGWWAADSQRAYFVDLKRDGQEVQIVEFNTLTGRTRKLFEETSSTWINLHPMNFHLPALIMPLPKTQELVWYSERSGWAHLYLYDLETGELKQVLTEGRWVVTDLLHFDAGRRELWLQTSGRNAEYDPYYKDICRVNVDSGELVTVISSDHNYTVKNRVSSFEFDQKLFGISSSADYLVVTRSRPDDVPVSLLLDRNGRKLLTLEEADVTGLPINWQWPEPVQLIAADGKTDIYGLVFRPSEFSPNKSYPVIDNVQSMPAGTLTCKGFDQGHHYMCAAALAELGFIVVQIDGRGTPYRSRAFLDHADGWYTSGSDLSDHIAGLKQLAERYPYMDLDRVGIFGGWTTSVGPLNGLLQYPDFFKVGVTTGMPQSQLYMSMCVEPMEGPRHRQNGFVQPEHLAGNLKGKLLMMHGMLDLLSAPAATFRMIEAFEKANKDFDLIMLPNQQHAGGRNPYVMRRIFDFFVRHLLGEEPPKDFDLRLGDNSEGEQ